MNELIQSGSDKDDKIDHSEKEKLEVINESEEVKSALLVARQKLTNLEASLVNKENTLNMYQKSSEEKDIALVDLNHMLQKEQKEKVSLATQYSTQLNDQTELNRTLQLENELLKQEIDRQLEISLSVKNDLESELKTIQEKCTSLDSTRGEQETSRHKYEIEAKELRQEIQSLTHQLVTLTDTSKQEKRNFEIEMKSLQEKCETLAYERNQYEDACQKYDTEISERIRENLRIMEDYDKSKVVEHKQLSFINELTKSNQDLTTNLRKLQSEFDEISVQLNLTKSEVSEAKEHQNKAFTQLEDEKKKSEMLQSDLGSRMQQITEHDQLSKNLQDKMERLQLCLDVTNHKLEEMTKEKAELAEQYGALEIEKTQRDEQAQGEIEGFVQRDQEQTSVLNKLVNDLEQTNQENLSKTEQVEKLTQDLNDLYERTHMKSINQLSTIQDLEKQVVDLTNTVDQQFGNINKLQDENRDLNNRVIECIETIEGLKVDKARLESHLAQFTDRSNLLQSELDGLKELYQRKCTECQEQEEKNEILEEASESQNNGLADLTDQNEYMVSHIHDLEQEVSQLKINIGKCVEKHKAELLQLAQQRKQTLDKLREELQVTRSKSQEELNELLNNFNEVENELTFCQDELINKSNELNQTREQLTDMTNAAVTKEQKLLQNLETLNEQNENILHSEIQKFKKEYDDKVLTLQESYNAEMTQLQDGFKARMSTMAQKNETELKEQAEIFKIKLEDASLIAIAEKEKLQEKFTRKASECDRIRTEMEIKSKNREVELTSKSRIINQLGRRIETQQKLVDYMMKSLETERAKHHNNGTPLCNASTDAMQLLSNLQSSLDDKLQQNPLAGEIYQYRQSLSSASSLQDLSLTHHYPPTTSSSPTRSRGARGEAFASTSEPVISPIPSPTPSPVTEKPPVLSNHDFNLYLRSSSLLSLPASKDHKDLHNQTFPVPSSSSFKLSSNQHKRNKVEQLSKSLPLDNVFIDHGYASPTHQNNSTKTVYFGEQIQTIMRTFEKLELMHNASGDDKSTSTPPINKELNLEIWKQKIHFRLKVLDDQMNEMDDSSSNNISSDFALLDRPSSSSSVRMKPSQGLNNDDGEETNGVIFHPTTREIRTLIENVNRRYKKLGHKYLTTVSDEL